MRTERVNRVKLVTSVLRVLQPAQVAQQATSTTVIILVVLLVVRESLAMHQHNRLQLWPAKIVQPGDIPKQLALARKVCVFNATLANIPTKLAIQIHRNAKNVVPDSFQMNPVWTSVQIVPPPKHLNLVQRFVPNVTRGNTCPPTKHAHVVI